MTDPLFEQADALMRRHQAATSSAATPTTAPPIERYDIELDLDAILESDPEPEATAAAAHSSANAATHAAEATDDAADDWPVLSDMVDAVDLSPSPLQATSLDAPPAAADEIPLLTEVAAVTNTRQDEQTVVAAETTTPDTLATDLSTEFDQISVPSDHVPESEVQPSPPPVSAESVSNTTDTHQETHEVALTLDHAALQQLIAEEVQAALTSELAPLIEQLSATLTERLTNELQQRLGQSLQQR